MYKKRRRSKITRQTQKKMERQHRRHTLTHSFLSFENLRLLKFAHHQRLEHSILGIRLLLYAVGTIYSALLMPGNEKNEFLPKVDPLFTVHAPLPPISTNLTIWILPSYFSPSSPNIAAPVKHLLVQTCSVGVNTCDVGIVTENLKIRPS